MKPLEIKTAPSPVTEALIFICEKCGKKLNDDPEKSPARDLQQALKQEIKNSGFKGRLRASVTSCMDLCPAKEMAICISSPSRTNQFITLPDGFQHDVAKTADELLMYVKARK